MQRIDTLTKAVDLFGPGKHGFKDGNPGEGIVATGLNAKFFNDVQEEVASFIEWAGLTLSEADSTQLRQALIAKFQAKHANLTALSGLAGVANKLPYFTGADTMALATFTELGAAPLDSAALTGSPTAPTPAFGLNNNRIATMAALQALRADILGVEMAQRPRKYAKNALPSADEGPIIVIGGDGVWEWSASAYYTGYRHPRCGEPSFGVTSTPRPHEVAAVGGVFNKADYPQLWGLAQESGLVVAQSQFDAELGAYWFVSVSGTQFRVPNLLGPNSWGMFPRWAAGGVDADTANAVIMGRRKLGTLESHAHMVLGRPPGVIAYPGSHSYIDAGGGAGSGPFSGGETTLTGAAETAPRHVAFHPRIHV